LPEAGRPRSRWIALRRSGECLPARAVQGSVHAIFEIASRRQDPVPICRPLIERSIRFVRRKQSPSSGEESMDKATPTTRQKALTLNLDARAYGTFAEIGGGQEVARSFFAAGGAAGTVAKSISAYDMAMSDILYGAAKRYVSRERLEAMLGLEFAQLVNQLGEKRGESKCFFAFANTVATRRFGSAENGRGWIGVRFQTQPREPPSEVIIHTHLLDREVAHQQEALGSVGVNLIYGAFFMHDAPERLIASLLDELSRERVEIDMVKFSGPAFARVDNRLMSLQLVELGLTDAAMFTALGEVV